MKPMMYEGEDLSNIITKVVMPSQVQKDVYNQDNIGPQEYARFVEECINTNDGQNEEGSTEDVEKCEEVSETQSRRPGCGIQG